jgi:hypothetical protein
LLHSVVRSCKKYFDSLCNVSSESDSKISELGPCVVQQIEDFALAFSGLCLSSGIVTIREHNGTETGHSYEWREKPILLGP